MIWVRTSNSRWIIAHQRNHRILPGKGFIGSFDVPVISDQGSWSGSSQRNTPIHSFLKFLRIQENGGGSIINITATLHYNGTPFQVCGWIFSGSGVVDDLFFQHNDYVGNQIDLNNYNVLLQNYFHCRIALNSHNPFFIPFIILFLFSWIKVAQFKALWFALFSVVISHCRLF